MTVSWEKFYADRTGCIRPSEIREFFKLTEKPEVVSFAGGFPSPCCFPVEKISQVLGELVLKEGAASLQYGPTEGNNELRCHLAEKMNSEGIDADSENIIVTNGSQQGLDLISKILIDPNDYVITEEPGYVGGLGAVTNYQGSVIPIPVDEQGLSTEKLEDKLGEMGEEVKKIKFAYVVPNFQNPTGAVLSLERRRHLLQLAHKYDFIIIEDNPYGEISFNETHLPSIKSMDTEGNVIYLGSFSKIFVPGIRVGWAVAEKEFIERLIAAKQATDLCSNTLGQRLVLYFISHGLLDAHVNEAIDYYKQKRDLMLNYMEQHFPQEMYWTVPQGGFFIWVTFPDKLKAREILLKSLEEKKVAFVDGSGFFTNGGGKNTARFSFSEASPEEIKEGISKLGELLQEERNKVYYAANKVI